MFEKFLFILFAATNKTGLLFTWIIIYRQSTMFRVFIKGKIVRICINQRNNPGLSFSALKERA